MSETQSLKNHARFDPFLSLFHLRALPAQPGVCGIPPVPQQTSLSSGWYLVLSLAAIVPIFKLRTYPLKVQDRVIRLEERLRLQSLAPQEWHAQIYRLNEGQLIALRFAGDDEVVELAKQALEHNLIVSRSRSGSRTGDRTTGGYDVAYSGGHRSRAWRFNPLRAKRIGRKIESMRHRVAAVMVTIALALPAIAQHGAARGGCRRSAEDLPDTQDLDTPVSPLRAEFRGLRLSQDKVDLQGQHLGDCARQGLREREFPLVGRDSLHACLSIAPLMGIAPDVGIGIAIATRAGGSPDCMAIRDWLVTRILM